MARLAPLAVLAFLLLSGCAGKAPASADAADDAGDDGSQPAGAAGPVTSLDAPTWSVGQWWEWEVSFGTETREETFCSIVVGAGGSGYTLATERDGMAKEEAAFSHPLLGPVGSGDLAMDGWGGDAWSLLQFPLTHGKTWTATMPNIAWDIVPAETVELSMLAHVMQASGEEGTIAHIQGKIGEQTLVSAIYDPATGWFRELSFYDVDAGDEGLEVGFRAVSHGMNYTGPIFQATAERLLDWFDGSGFTDVPTEGGQPFASPSPYVSFTVAGGEGHLLYGVLVAEAVIGARAIALVGPDNQPRYFEAHDAALEGAGNALWLDEPALAGTWHVASGGAGGFSAAFGAVWEVVLTETAL